MRCLALWLCIALGSAPFAMGAAEPLFSAADEAVLQRDLVSKLQVAEKALDGATASVAPPSARGDAHLFLGHFAAAVADYEKMIALDPTEDAPHWRLGIAYYFAGAWEKSSRQFAKYHAYDGHDRENGVWKFLADVQWHGLAQARSEMLLYNAFDREPFPALYELLAGRQTQAQLQAHLEAAKLTRDPQAMFFAHYYGGLQRELQGEHAGALHELRQAITLFRPADAGRGGPGFMWHAARLHYGQLAAQP